MDAPERVQGGRQGARTRPGPKQGAHAGLGALPPLPLLPQLLAPPSLARASGAAPVRGVHLHRLLFAHLPPRRARLLAVGVEQVTHRDLAGAHGAAAHH
jgi:hypothetical protein